MVQRDHEQKSQIVERRIRDDAALEEAKRKEQATKEEKLRQERARQEAEVCYAQI
jgi:nucleoporin GLE1